MVAPEHHEFHLDVAIALIVAAWFPFLAAAQLVGQAPVAPANPLQIDEQSIVEPEMADVFFVLRKGRLIALERREPIMRHTTAGVLVMKTRSTLEIPAAKSSIRLPSEDQLEFVVRSAEATSEMDFSTVFSLRRLESRKGVRELLFGSGHITPTGGTSQTDFNYGSVPVKFSRFGEHSLKMKVGQLPPGEYACLRGMGRVMFCFGVD